MTQPRRQQSTTAPEATELYQPQDFSNLKDLEGLSAEAIELHLELYRGYVENVNQLLAETTPEMRRRGQVPDIAQAATQARRFAFEYNGMILHELFFEALSTSLGAVPAEEGVFAEAADQCFGGIEPWKDDLRRMAQTRGVGWVVCVRERASNRIFNTWIDLHHLGLPVRTDPVLVIDLWEHAYLKDFKPSQRKDYVELLLSQTDWQTIEKRCKATKA